MQKQIKTYRLSEEALSAVNRIITLFNGDTKLSESGAVETLLKIINTIDDDTLLAFKDIIIINDGRKERWKEKTTVEAVLEPAGKSQ